MEIAIAQLRWDPTPIPKTEMTFLQGVQTMTTAGDASTQAGMGGACLFHHQIDGRSAFLQCRWRDAVRAATGRICVSSPNSAGSTAGPGEIVVIRAG